MFDYDDSFIVDRINDRTPDDEQLVCDACFGKGRLIDRWGPMHCWRCQGTGVVSLGAWLVYVKTFPPTIQQHMLEHQPPAYTNGGNHHAR